MYNIYKIIASSQFTEQRVAGFDAARKFRSIVTRFLLFHVNYLITRRETKIEITRVTLYSE